MEGGTPLREGGKHGGYISRGNLYLGAKGGGGIPSVPSCNQTLISPKKTTRNQKNSIYKGDFNPSTPYQIQRLFFYLYDMSECVY